LNTFDDGDVDFGQYAKAHPEHAHVHPASAYVGAVIDRMYGAKSNAGHLLPWSKTHSHFRMRPGEVTIWAGVNGTGKSQILNQVILSIMHAGGTACIASMEMKPVATLARMVRQAAGGPSPSGEYVMAFHDWLDDKLWLYDQQGTVKPNRMLGVLRYCHAGVFGRYEVKNRKGETVVVEKPEKPRVRIDHFVIDSLMKCGINSDDYNRQKIFVDELCCHARDTGVHIHLVAHARKGESSRAHVDKFDIKGASEISDLVDNVFSVWRNKGKEDEAQKQFPDAEIMAQPCATLTCSKQRHGEWEGKIKLWFDRASLQYVAADGLRPISYFGG
jgi:twinkle protein